MSCIHYISFPKKLCALRACDIVGREIEFGINYDLRYARVDMYVFPNAPYWEANIVIFDKNTATFNNCFKNEFIYEIWRIGVDSEHFEQSIEVMKKYPNADDEIRIRELAKINDSEILLNQKVMYDFLDCNLAVGEFAEMYESWHDHINFNFEPPTSEQFINLSDMLTTVFNSPPLKTNERRKCTIVK